MSETVSDLEHALSPGAQVATAVFEPRVLAQLRELDPTGQAGVVARVLATYEASLLQVQAQLLQAQSRSQASQTAPDAALVGGRAHMLKSSSASVGALRLAQLCERIEARARDTGSLAPLDLQSFLSEIQATLLALRPLLGRA